MLLYIIGLISGAIIETLVLYLIKRLRERKCERGFEQMSRLPKKIYKFRRRTTDTLVQGGAEAGFVNMMNH